MRSELVEARGTDVCTLSVVEMQQKMLPRPAQGASTPAWMHPSKGSGHNSTGLVRRHLDKLRAHAGALSFTG